MARIAVSIVSLTAILAWSVGDAHANSHLWRISEVFSNADGSVQFIEMQEIAGADHEFELAGKTFFSDTRAFVPPNDLPDGTAFKTFLLATQGFADLPGAPSPDYIIPDGFFDPSGDTLVYFIYDVFQFGPGVVPTDGVQSVNRFTLATAANSPRNFAGVEASVPAPPFTDCVLKLDSSHAGGQLQLGFEIGLAGAGTWNTWMFVANSALPLWSIPLPAGLPLLSFPVAFPLANLGNVGVLTTLTTPAGGIVCSDFREQATE